MHWSMVVGVGVLETHWGWAIGGNELEIFSDGGETVKGMKLSVMVTNKDKV